MQIGDVTSYVDVTYVRIHTVMIFERYIHIKDPFRIRRILFRSIVGYISKTHPLKIQDIFYGGDRTIISQDSTIEIINFISCHLQHLRNFTCVNLCNLLLYSNVFETVSFFLLTTGRTDWTGEVLKQKLSFYKFKIQSIGQQNYISSIFTMNNGW